MTTLRDLVDDKRLSEKLSLEKMSRVVNISRNQFTIVMNTGFTEGTELKTIRGFATLLNMEAWKLLRILDDSDSH